MKYELMIYTTWFVCS